VVVVRSRPTLGTCGCCKQTNRPFLALTYKNRCRLKLKNENRKRKNQNEKAVHGKIGGNVHK